MRGEFGGPTCISIKDDRIYLIEQGRTSIYDAPDESGAGKRLIVLELDGTTHQEMLLPDAKDLQSVCFLGDELWIPDTEDVSNPNLGHENTNPRGKALHVLRAV